MKIRASNPVPVVLQVQVSYQAGITDVTGDGAVELIAGKMHDVQRAIASQRRQSAGKSVSLHTLQVAVFHQTVQQGPGLHQDNVCVYGSF